MSGKYTKEDLLKYAEKIKKIADKMYGKKTAIRVKQKIDEAVQEMIEGMEYEN